MIDKKVRATGRKAVIGGKLSINDLRDLEFNGTILDEQQKRALARYDQYRLNILNGTKSDEDFHLRYLELQVLANLAPYTDLLLPNYDI